MATVLMAHAAWQHEHHCCADPRSPCRRLNATTAYKNVLMTSIFIALTLLKHVRVRTCASSEKRASPACSQQRLVFSAIAGKTEHHLIEGMNQRVLHCSACSLITVSTKQSAVRSCDSKLAKAKRRAGNSQNIQVIRHMSSADATMYGCMHVDVATAARRRRVSDSPLDTAPRGAVARGTPCTTRKR